MRLLYRCDLSIEIPFQAVKIAIVKSRVIFLMLINNETINLAYPGIYKFIGQ